MTETIWNGIVLPKPSDEFFFQSGSQENGHILNLFGSGLATSCMQPRFLAAILNQHENYGYSVAGINYGGETLVKDWRECQAKFLQELQIILKWRHIEEINLIGLSFSGLIFLLATLTDEFAKLKGVEKITNIFPINPALELEENKHPDLLKVLSTRPLRGAAARVLPDRKFTPADTPDELMPYRENPVIPMRSILEMVSAEKHWQKSKDKVELPVHGVFSTGDTVINTPRCKELLEANCSNVTVTTIEGAPHNLFLCGWTFELAKILHGIIQSKRG